MNVQLATTAELVSFYNANVPADKLIKKFADRKTAERRCNELQQRIWAAERSSEVRIDQLLVAPAEVAESNSSVSDYAVHGHTNCPSCGVHLSNGVGVDGQEVNGKTIRHDAFQFECLACGHEFGPAVVKTNHYVRPSGAPITSRPALVASLKLDRRILSVASGIVYENACQVWKAGLVSAAQGDRLSAVLYGAAKAGNRLMSVTINGHVFTLANK